MLVTGDAAMAKAARVLRLHGIDRDAFDRFTAVGSDAWRYDIVAPGFKYNMTDVAAAMGLVQLRRAEVMRQRREQIAGAYRHLLADLPLTLPREAAPGSVHAWHLFVVRVLPGSAKSRDEVGRGLASRGVGTSVHYRPLHQHSYWRDRYRLRMEDFPAANHAFDSALSLPIHSQMTDEDVQYVSDELVRLMT
jgi:dTDP-4-amino-4,6-dideoxygalactose transaminase